MLWTIAVVLVVLWALGFFTHVAGGTDSRTLSRSRHYDCTQLGPPRPSRVTD